MDRATFHRYRVGLYMSGGGLNINAVGEQRRANNQIGREMDEAKT